MVLLNIENVIHIYLAVLRPFILFRCIDDEERLINIMNLSNISDQKHVSIIYLLRTVESHFYTIIL